MKLGSKVFVQIDESPFVEEVEIVEKRSSFISSYNYGVKTNKGEVIYLSKDYLFPTYEDAANDIIKRATVMRDRMQAAIDFLTKTKNER